MSQDRDLIAALEHSNERLWEWARDIYDLYLVDSGAGAGTHLVLPPWGDLSPSSRLAVSAMAAETASTMMDAAILLVPEVEVSDGTSD